MKKAFLAAIAAFGLLPSNLAGQIAGHVVISEIYGAGGNVGATFKNDYVELYNPTASPVPLSGWSIQYASATGTGAWHASPLGGSILPYSYYLVQFSGGTAGVAIPAADTTGSTNLSATAGKVALVRSTAPITGANPADTTIVDLVGYGSADGYEGAGPAPGPGASTSIERKATPQATASGMAPGGADAGNGNGWDSNSNAADFVAQPAPNPQNSGSPIERPPDDLLPIRFGEISAEAKAESGVLVTWTTLSETACYGFEIERSDHAAEGFTNISGLIPGHGTTVTTHTYTFIDPAGTSGRFYRVREIDTNGADWLSETIMSTGVSTVKEEASSQAPEFRSFPNPFNPATTVTFTLKTSAIVTLSVYDILGKRIKTLASGRCEAGTHSLRWDASGSPSGVYICRLEGIPRPGALKLILAK
ncbi:MAG TPA: lamin tail domain-containing protein [Spirochaetia bacterium]|nr:lamin tail domain-containing protein [Spirochaetia bacterium]